MKTKLITTALLSIALLALGGCPHMLMGDPATETRLVNRTAQPIEVGLILDPTTYGLKPTADASPFALNWLEEFKAGQGVDPLELEPAQLKGRYRVAPSGFMIVHASLGTRPWFHFKTLKVTQGEKTLTVIGLSEITKRFPSTGEGNLFECAVTDESLSGK